MVNRATIATVPAAALGAGREERLRVGRLLGPASADVPESAEDERSDDDENYVGHATAFLFE
jgi:hypothetical protein